MNHRQSMLTGVAAGAGLMYFFDPERGKRRRAWGRDQLRRAYHQSARMLAMARRDTIQRTGGLIAEARALLERGEVPDDMLAQRVRAKMGRFVSHPRALRVTANQGQVTLSGPILRREVAPLLRAVARVRGVCSVEPDLEIYQRGDHISALQGGAKRPGERFEFMQEHWAPAARILAIATGTAITLAALRRGGRIGPVIGTAASLLLVRGLTDLEVKRILGIGANGTGINIRKAININAPIEDVFQFWSNLEGYPRFMTHVQEITRTGPSQFRWVVDGPAGSVLRWDAVVTELVPNKVLAWKTVPGTVVAQAGITRFDTNPDGSTRVDVRMSYNPPAGLIGHVLAKVTGRDSKHLMDEDLVRFKSLLEHGRTTAHGQQVTLEELAEGLGHPVDSELSVSESAEPA
jgi:uncharacterized membrane protein